LQNPCPAFAGWGKPCDAGQDLSGTPNIGKALFAIMRPGDRVSINFTAAQHSFARISAKTGQECVEKLYKTRTRSILFC
jgi:hypothetical protein